jgi:hypothetical protein
MAIRISKEGKLFVEGRFVGEINKELIEDEDIKKDIRRLLMKERSEWLKRVRSEKINVRRLFV